MAQTYNVELMLSNTLKDLIIPHRALSVYEYTSSKDLLCIVKWLRQNLGSNRENYIEDDITGATIATYSN